MDSKKRIDAYDLLKAFAIFLVVLGHVVQHCLTSDHYDEPFYIIIYTFHMPLFMVLCGFFSWHSMRLSFGEMVIKKINSIIIPCISWGIIIYLSLFVVHIIKNKSVGNIFDFFIFIWNEYWFLKALFICYVLTWACVNSKISKYLLYPILCLAVQFMPFFNIPIMLPCFIFGLLLKNIIEKKWLPKFIPFFLLLYLIFLFYYQREYFDGTIEIYWWNSNFSLCSLGKIFLLRCYRFVLGVSATMFLVTFARKYLWNITFGKSRLIDYILQCGKDSMGIYLIHTLLVSYLMHNFIHFDGLDGLIFNVLIAPIVSVIIIITCEKVITLLNKSDVLTFLLFGSNYTSRGRI